jgi:hypothetical protein
MIRAALQLAENPDQKILADLNDTPLAGRIEHLLREPKFFFSHHAFSSQVPSPYKKQRLNFNASPSFGSSPNSGRGQASPRRMTNTDGGRGFRGRRSDMGFFSFRNPFIGSPQTTGGNFVTEEANSNISEYMSPIKRRVLLWNDDV